MNRKEIDEKIKKAESYRKKPNFIFALFGGPDYMASGDLFAEGSFISECLDDKEKYYNEAALTYLIKKSEYSYFRAGEIYKKLSEIFEAQNAKKSLEYLLKYAENLEKAERYLIAGQVCMKIACKYENLSAYESIKYYLKAYETYSKDSGCPYHMKEARQKCLQIQLRKSDLEGAIESFDLLNIKFSKLCKSILCLLLGKPMINDDLENIQESELIMGLVNKSAPECIEIMDDFASEFFLPDYARLVFDLAIEKFKPENYIC